MTHRSQVTAHVLDAIHGRPAVGVPVLLEQWRGGAWAELAGAETDSDGRVSELGPESVGAGRFRLTFDTGAYFGRSDQATLYPEVAVTFEISDAVEHYHVPLLLSPFAYSTYRGS